MRVQTAIKPITDWKQFGREVREKGHKLLGSLDTFPDSILVTGCQRSGTTMTANILMGTEGVVDYTGVANYSRGQDISFDSAMLLCGLSVPPAPGRYCFQATHINECYHEYFEHQVGHKMVWVVRNPHSVVTSMLYNWHGWAMDELFRDCGVNDLSAAERRKYQLLSHPVINKLQGTSLNYSRRGGRFLRLDSYVSEESLMVVDYDDQRRARGIRKLARACHNYNIKVKQLKIVAEKYPENQLFVLDYDTLVQHKHSVLPSLYEFVGLEYKPAYANQIQSSSLKKRTQLSESQQQTISTMCTVAYEQAAAYVTPLPL